MKIWSVEHSPGVYVAEFFAVSIDLAIQLNAIITSAVVTDGSWVLYCSLGEVWFALA